MLRMIVLFAIMLSILRGQTPYDVVAIASRMDHLIVEGKYPQAVDLAATTLTKLRFADRGSRSIPILDYLLRTQVDVGQLQEAARVLESAIDLAKQEREWDYSQRLVREQAALLYAQGDYVAAATHAARAGQLLRSGHYLNMRTAYCDSLHALALLRLGNSTEAATIARTALSLLPSDSSHDALWSPRTIFAVAIVQAHNGLPAEAQALCQRGLAIANRIPRPTREKALGKLALAEIHSLANNWPATRDAAHESALITAKLFGLHHQDMVDALHLLAIANHKNGNETAARECAEKAVSLATGLFGPNNPITTRTARTLATLTP